MKVTPALKKELAQWLNTYWTTYLKGDIETWATFLRDDYRNIGGTKEEIWNSKQEIIDYTTRILDQMLGTAEIRNREIEVIPYGDYMMVNEFTDLYVKIEGEWTFYGPFRMSSLLERTDESWIALHQHGSYPDMKAMEGEAFSIDAMKAENARLLAAVKSRTIELEIEAALERVRAVAMGMKKPEDLLEVCRVISDQLQDFGVEKIRNVQIAIIDENIGQYLCYQYFTPYDKTAVEKTEYLKSPVEYGMVKQMLASRKGYFIGSLSGKELEEFRSHRIEENHFADPFLDKATEIDYCFLSIGEGGLGLTLYQPMAEDILTLFKRFHQVFSLAYQRFRDIQKAEAQAREAQIEAAVERIRAQSMAMHHPDDLDKVNKEILSQLNWLQVQGLSGVTFYLVDQDGWVKAWDFSSPGNIGYQKSYTLQFDFKKYEMMGYPFRIFQQTDLNYLVADYPLEKLERAVFELEEINSEVATVVKDALAKGILTHQWSACARITDGLLAIDMVSPPSEDTKIIVLKIAGAFNQAYQRFLDLQKAEAHARESEIDLALERVRAQTMAMHSSEDVGKCVVKMFSELTALGVDEGTRFGIGILNHDNENNQLWTARKNGDEVNMHIGNIDMASHPLLKSARKAWLAQVPLHNYVLEGEDLLNYYQMLNNAPDYKIQIPIEKLPRKEIQHCFIFEHGFFYAFSPREFQPDLIHITQRFSSLFEQTYRRYLDLVRAEAQAREAEIQLSLERVRARSLAMHNTHELQDVVNVVAQQLMQMGIDMDGGVFIAINDELTKDFPIWAAAGAADYVQKVTIPFLDRPTFTRLKNAIVNRESFLTESYSKEEKNEFLNHLFLHHPWNLNSAERKAELLSRDGGYIRSISVNRHTAIGITNHHGNKFSDAENAILVRFGAVLEQSYTRFLDLQKAEAQAREAQIEAALEKVRSRSLAMHKSNELTEVVAVLFEKLKDQQIPFTAVGIATNIEGSKDLNAFVCGQNEAGLVITNYRLHYFDNQIPKDLYRAIEEKLDYFVGHYSKEEKDAFYEYVIEHTAEFRHLPEDIKRMIFDSTTYTISMVAVKNAVFNVNDFEGKVLAEQEIDIIKRFARVFDQAYIRFLDLQKAEAQARESQIQLALERVRARTMAMQHSDELQDAAILLFQQVKALGVQTGSCGFNIWNKDEKTATVWMSSAEGGLQSPFILPHAESAIYKQVYKAWKNGELFLVKEVDGIILKKHFDYLLTLPEIGEVIKKLREAGYAFPETMVYHFAFFSHGYLSFHLHEHHLETHDIFKRFAKVFEQTYTRFLDLQKAEAQARDSQIQLALERVRARTMAMQHSDEMADASQVLDQQVRTLGIETWGCAFHIYADNAEGDYEWFSSANGNLPFYKTPREKFFLKFYEKGQQGEKFHVEEFKDEDCKAHYDFLKTIPVVGDALRALEESGIPLPAYQIDHIAFFKHGYILFITYQPVVEAHDIFQRFAKVFDQTYTRFLDLQKAEAQTREAQIEAALERVRSRSMAMHKSEELLDVITVVSEQLHQLGFRFNHVSFANNEIDQDYKFWSSLKGMNPVRFNVPFANLSVFTGLKKAQQDGVHFYTDILNRKDNRKWHAHLLEYGGSQIFSEEINEYIMRRGMARSISINPNIILILANYASVPYTEEENKIIKRFGNVFEQSYTRFLDLQKAEAQAREAKIETALEKVRSRTMGMQSSEELPEVANLLFMEVQALGIPAWSCGYNILSEDKTSSTCIMSSEGTLQKPFPLPLTGEASFIDWYHFLQNEELFFTQELGGNAIDDHYNYMISLPELKPIFKDIQDAGLSLPTYQINHLCKFTSGFLLFITYEKVPESHDIFRRFTYVFDQTYTRFLDLKKAEAQAREAQIENALEKVRSRSLAMQSPDELIEVAQLLREEMGALGVEELETSSIYIHDDTSGSTQCWFTIKNPDNPDKAVTDQMTIVLQDTWVGRKMLDFYRSPSNHTSILMQGEQRIEWIRYCEKKTELFGISNFYGETIPDRTYHLYKFSNGYIGAAAPGEISTESWELLKRATAVFSFAYTRFRDLQMAQSSARASMRQASLDRVRADISSMRNADDLNRITPLVFNELTTLGIPFIRCGVFIVHEKSKNVEVYLSTPEGKSLAVMNLPFDSNEMTARSVESWKKGEVYVRHWNQSDFLNWGKSMQEQGYVKDLKTYQGAEAAPESLHLHFVPFAQGLLYIGSPETLAEEQIDLVKALAKSFAIAYARYEDFVKLEKAKAEVDSAMSELKATQSQLVQQEKLASLGQLTAGIAHEIKNPLNFVNNFSEVSIEMIEEIKEERAKSQETRDETLVDEILEDIKGNLRKIHEHGSRANGIVTSMLQHSRGGSGKMEPTDLNALIKEYVNLSFHGMRAGKNPINVDIVLDLDLEIKDVSLVKEDFTRVVINLSNNAFDAMREKILMTQDTRHKTQDGAVIDESYLPKLKVTTILENGRVRISFEDNGPGIPDEIKDKILQPFFTTKKGTEGTGLGLSITHDIIKAHGGELKVESLKAENQGFEGQGSRFTITLPQS